MFTIVLIVIYIAFISLGLPDSLLGTAWPVMRLDLHAPLSVAGMVSMIVTGGTIVSSLLSEKMIRRFGTGKVTFISVMMTALALFGFNISGSILFLCLFAVPLGLGGGAVDSALNNFVALHFEARHMNWLHCFWGVGATSGPLIMSIFLGEKDGWRTSYLVIAGLQIVLVIILAISLPLWKKFETSDMSSECISDEKVQGKIFSLPVVKYTLLSCFCYCAIETTAGLWGSSYLVLTKGISFNVAARGVSLFYLGITAGRFFSGIISMKLNNQQLVRVGEVSILCGIIVLFLPLPAGFSLIGFILIGLGCAPIFPSLLHDTPNKVGQELSQKMMGIQMASAYVGSTVMPPAFGLLAEKIGTGILPLLLLVVLLTMIICTEKADKILKNTNVA